MVFMVTLESDSENSDIMKAMCNSKELEKCFVQVLNDKDKLDMLSSLKLDEKDI